jgi:hypothetical protein
VCYRHLLNLERKRARLLQDELAIRFTCRVAVARDARTLLFEDIERSHQPRLVRVTRGAFAIWLHPFGMLHPQVVVNLSTQLRVCMHLVKHVC